MEQSESRNILLSVLGIAILLLAVVGVTYAVFTFTSESNRENHISTGSISMNYIEGITNVMTITNAIPIINIIVTTTTLKAKYSPNLYFLFTSVT